MSGREKAATRLGCNRLICLAVPQVPSGQIIPAPMPPSFFDAVSMSGLQEITAIFAVVELGVKSLSAVYNLIQTLRHIPTRIEQAKHEVRDILNCLAGLRFIHTADRGTIHAINRAGLEASVSSCREACDQLRGLLSTWDPLQSSITAKLKYFRYRKAFDGLLNDITNRKQNTTLAVGITQL